MRTENRRKNCRLQYKGKMQHAVLTRCYRKQTKTCTLLTHIEVKLILESDKRSNNVQDSRCVLHDGNKKMSGGSWRLHYTAFYSLSSFYAQLAAVYAHQTF